MNLYSILSCNEPHSQVQIDTNNPQTVRGLRACHCFGDRLNAAIAAVCQVMGEQQANLEGLRVARTNVVLNTRLLNDYNAHMEQFSRLSCPTCPHDSTYATWINECRVITQARSQAIRDILSEGIPPPQAPRGLAQSQLKLPATHAVYRLGLLNSLVVLLTKGTQPTVPLLNYRNLSTDGFQYCPAADAMDIICLPDDRVAVGERNRISIHSRDCMAIPLGNGPDITAICIERGTTLWNARVDHSVQFHRIGTNAVTNVDFGVPPIRAMAANQDYLIAGVENTSVLVWKKDENHLPLVHQAACDSAALVIEPHPSEPNLFLTGGEWGDALLWDIRQSGPIQSTWMGPNIARAFTVRRLIWNGNQALSGDRGGVFCWDIRQPSTHFWSVEGSQVDFGIRDNSIFQVDSLGVLTILSLPS